MYGVVLWCSADSQKAVIWCEDHGDLAFYEEATAATALDAGDLVKFRSEQSRRRRLARDLELVAQDRFPGLPDGLKAVGPAETPENDIQGGNIVMFDGGRDRRSVAAPLMPRRRLSV